ncbi:MAG TPA: fibronectin type III domain-containing protein, partial [Jatrophihabitans sp.]|nr:fibronectin type III domain-containing protein [Jatrophihabitans sp.]
TLKGWAIDRDTPVQPVTVKVSIDGTVTNVVANQFRKDVADSHSVAGGNHGFAVTLAEKQGTHKICVTAVNIWYGSDNSFGCKSVWMNDNPRGAFQAAAVQSGRLRLVGWSVDGDKPNAVVTMAIKVDSTTHQVPASVARSDMAKLYPNAGNNHGFDVSYTLAEGSHTICVTATNIGFGTNQNLGCKTVVINFTPAAAITGLNATSTGARLTGWASDPDTSNPISVQLSVDSKTTTLTANGPGGSHSGHNFAATLGLKSGAHKVCAVGLNVLYGTHNSAPACSTITLALSPLGKFESLARQSGSSNLAVRGWALDPDTTGAVSIQVILDGKTIATVPANANRADIGSAYPGFGANHGISTVVSTDAGEHRVCLNAVNVGGGSNVALGCRLIIAVHPTAPSAPQQVTAMAGYGGAQVSWQPPASDGGAPWTKYTVTASPSGLSATVDAGTTSATILGLHPSTTYTFSVTASNVAGASVAGLSSAVKTQASPPAQTTPAPVSTSRYIRNIRTASAAEQSTMRNEGATDAFYNPSGHGYLILLDIGGQDQFDGGVVLSATTRFVAYSALVADLKAYVDGYASKQKPSAPITIAIGTNNDMDVSAASGKAWATQVVNPVAAYVKGRYPGITITGANDIEPGFRASYSATKAWLTGYLGASNAPFVFNGSADGCSWTTTKGGCNNGWNMSGLYYLAAGAAPIRTLNLPQIYNTTMAAQWKYISLTGVTSGQPRINFGGPLTEWTACSQTNSCGSLTGHSAWSTMWSNLQSDSRLKVASLPYSTDLRIDR